MHRENLLQWKEINPLKGSVRVLEEGMAALHLREEVKAQMAALEETDQGVGVSSSGD